MVVSSEEIVCNACGFVGRTSREHLIHLAIGRVIVGDWALDRQGIDTHLRDDWWARFECVQVDRRVRKAALADAFVRNLICEACNQNWANELEEEAGRQLFRFIFEDGPAAHILRRWVWWFAVKAWWLDTRTEDLRTGPLLPLLKDLAKPGSRVLMQVRVARLMADTDRWRLHFVVPARAPAEGGLALLLVVRRAVFVAMAKDTDGMNPLAFPTAELIPGIRLRSDAPQIRPAHLMAVPGVREVLETREALAG